MVTRSSMLGRSSPTIERTGVSSARLPDSISAIVVSAVKPLVPLAVANRVVSSFGRRLARSA